MTCIWSLFLCITEGLVPSQSGVGWGNRFSLSWTIFWLSALTVLNFIILAKIE